MCSDQLTASGGMAAWSGFTSPVFEFCCWRPQGQSMRGRETYIESEVFAAKDSGMSMPTIAII